MEREHEYLTDPLLHWFGELCQNGKVCIPLPQPLDTFGTALHRMSRAAKAMGYVALWSTNPADYPDQTGEWLVVRLAVQDRFAETARSEEL